MTCDGNQVGLEWPGLVAHHHGEIEIEIGQFASSGTETRREFEARVRAFLSVHSSPRRCSPLSRSWAPPGMLLPGTWRASWEQAKDVQLRLMLLTYLLVRYLIMLALLVASEAIEENELEDWYIVHDIFGYLALVAFMLSVWLPFEIKNIQINRLGQEIKARRGKKT